MAAQQDRRTNMIHSSVKAPAKKGGAGGSYTWGQATDVQDFTPVGLPAQGVGLVTAPAPVAAQAVTMNQTRVEPLNSLYAFPTLGAGTVQVANQNWGPPPAVVPQVLNQTSLRSGAIDVVGAQHPRNMFAKKPYTAQRQQAVQVVAQAQDGMIDWNTSGIPASVMQTIVQSPQAAAHLGPFSNQLAPQVPLQTLRAQNVGMAAGYQTVTPQVAKTVVTNQRTISGGIKQPR